MKTLTPSEQLIIAQALVEFCGGDLSVDAANQFFTKTEPDLTEAQQNKVFIMALSIMMPAK